MPREQPLGKRQQDDERDDAEQRVGGPPADERDARDRQRRKDDLAERRSERGDAERPPPLPIERAGGGGRLDVDHQALAGEPQKEERQEQRQRVDRAGHDETGDGEPGDDGGAEMDQPHAVDEVADEDEREGGGERAGEIKRADPRRRNAERAGNGGDEKPDAEGLSGRGIEGMQGAKASGRACLRTKAR